MQQAKAITKQIEACQAEICRLEAEIERCNAHAAAVGPHAEALQDLRRRRAEELARAFIEQRPEKLGSLDKEISAAEGRHALSISHASVARDGLRIIEDRLTGLRDELTAARAELTAVVLEEVSRRRADVQSQFNGIVESLRGPLAELRALDAMAGTLRGVHVALPQSEQLSRALLDDGLRVVNETGIRAPIWLRTIHSEAGEPYMVLATEFRSLGLDI